MKLEHKVDWAANRAKEYPSPATQLDAIYKGFVALKEQGYVLPAETEEWLEACSNVKLAYPKGE